MKPTCSFWSHDQNYICSTYVYFFENLNVTNTSTCIVFYVLKRRTCIAINLLQENKLTHAREENLRTNIPEFDELECRPSNVKNVAKFLNTRKFPTDIIVQLLINFSKMVI